MAHDTVSSVAVTSRRMALRCFVPGVAAPIIHVAADELSPAAWTAAGQVCSLTECSK